LTSGRRSSAVRGFAITANVTSRAAYRRANDPAWIAGLARRWTSSRRVRAGPFVVVVIRSTNGRHERETPVSWIRRAPRRNHEPCLGTPEPGPGTSETANREPPTKRPPHPPDHTDARP
jgi:hypothetical protein